jgi:hypothetical protein
MKLDLKDYFKNQIEHTWQRRFQSCRSGAWQSGDVSSHPIDMGSPFLLRRSGEDCGSHAVSRILLRPSDTLPLGEGKKRTGQ